jgi:hypothetical protein
MMAAHAYPVTDLRDRQVRVELAVAADATGSTRLNAVIEGRV